MNKSIQHKYHKKTNISTTGSVSSQKNQSQQNRFREEISKIAEECKFDETHIISCFEKYNISSSDFTLYKFMEKRSFILEFCKNKCNTPIKTNYLIKLWKALKAKYNLLSNRPCCATKINSTVWGKNSLVYIPQNCTEDIIQNNIIREPFVESKRLYQYLNWNIRINKINQFIKVYRAMNGIETMIINSGLHDKYNEVLYILCVQNDRISRGSQQWQLVKLVTGQEIMQLAPEMNAHKKQLLISGYIRDIIPNKSNTEKVIQLIGEYGYIPCTHSANSIELPLGARTNGYQFNSIRSKQLKSKTAIYNQRLSQNKYRQLKGVRTGYNKKNGENKETLQVSLSEFHRCISYALKSNDSKNDLIPIVSILTGKKHKNGEYKIDQLLPVEINNNWIGIVYRDGLPVMTLIDGYDITNKAILCNPSFDKTKLKWFTKNITKIEIVPSIRNVSISNTNGIQYVNKNTVIYSDDDEKFTENDDKLDNKVDINTAAVVVVEGNTNTGSIDTNTTNTGCTDGISDGSDSNTNVTMDGYQQYQTTTTVPSGYGSYQFMSYNPQNTLSSVYPISTATTPIGTSTNYNILSTQHAQIPVEGMNYVNNVIQRAHADIAFFQQYLNPNKYGNVSSQYMYSPNNFNNAYS